jgi:hypothetical protein
MTANAKNLEAKPDLYTRFVKVVAWPMGGLKSTRT